MNNKDIQQLVDKYLTGETSPAEEQMLALELQQRHNEIPEDWQVVSLMLGELTLGEAEYDAILTSEGLDAPLLSDNHHPSTTTQHPAKPSALLIALRTVSSIAALWFIGLFLYQRIPAPEQQLTTNEVPHYYTSHLTAGNTLKDVYTNRQQQDQLISYTQLRKMIYEKK